MAEPITIQKLTDASFDADTLGEFANEDKLVTSRLGAKYPSAPMASRLVVENGLLGATPFGTYSAMTASSLVDGDYAVVTNDADLGKNGVYHKTSGVWEYIKYNPLAQVGMALRENALVTPVKLSADTSLDELKAAGIYHVPTDTVAIGLSVPTGVNGQLYVSGFTSGTSGYVYQTYINNGGDIFQRRFTSSWNEWRGSRNTTLNSAVDLNDLVDSGTYHCMAAAYATTALNYPFTAAGAIIIATKDPRTSFVRQHILSVKGSAQRYARKVGADFVWSEWSGLSYPSAEEGVIPKAVELGGITNITVTSMADIGGNLDDIYTDGNYFINSGTLASPENGFPISGSGGFLSIRTNVQGYTHQYWTTYGGHAYRWGRKVDGVNSWRNWRGSYTASDGVKNLSEEASDTLLVYGSSTMGYLGNELQELCDRKGLTLRNHGLSGDTIGGAGQSQGSNIVEVSFTDGTINPSERQSISVTSSFGQAGHQTRTVTLSNGVVGKYHGDDTFTATNISEPLSAPSGEKYRIFEYPWYTLVDAVYIFNIGKNNVSSVEDNSQFIIDNTIAMIEYIPKDANFIVGGHYSNTDSSDTHRTVVESVNAALKSKYGLKYFDINDILFSDATWLKLGLTKTALDITAISNRRLPPSLSRDSGHLSGAMDIELALVIENKLVKLGYVA